MLENSSDGTSTYAVRHKFSHPSQIFLPGVLVIVHVIEKLVDLSSQYFFIFKIKRNLLMSKNVVKIYKCEMCSPVKPKCC